MNRIKKLAALLLALCMLAGLCACSLDSQDVAAIAQVLAEAAESLSTPAPDGKNAGDSELSLAASTPAPAKAETPAPGEEPEDVLDPDGEYTTKEDVALYLHLYGELPKNFITKNEARDLGWSGGGLDDYAYGMSIGGDRFGNYEGILPPGNYHECDIDTMHARSRGAKRLVYADDGRIYYTDDHYESFTLLYGEE